MKEAVLGAFGFLAIGGAGVYLWLACRKSRAKWDKYTRAFAASTSERFAYGFTGSGILCYAGLIIAGAGMLGFVALGQNADEPSVMNDVGLGSFVVGMTCMMLGLFSSVVVAMVQRPSWFFPHPH